MDEQMIASRFWAKVAVGWSGDCWEWRAGRNSRGYGSFGVNGKTCKAHRVAYELANGPIPVGMFICHRCDNPLCCNPEHLFAGTHKDNMRDMVAKGRGKSPFQAKLSEADVRKVRRLIAAGHDHKWIAKQIGVDRSNISLIANRRIWANV